MTNSVTFIAPKLDESTVNGVVTILHLKYTHEELVELVRAGDPGLFTVPQSHAEQVLRPQRHYQEVSDDILDEGNTPLEDDDNGDDEPAPSSTRRGEPDGSNDVERT